MIPRAWLVGVALAFSACRTVPGILGALDVESEADARDATAEMVEILLDAGAPESHALAAVTVLARLRREDPGVIEVLAARLADPAESRELRARSAHALGELHAEAALDPLIAALSIPMDPRTSYYLLEAIAKNYDRIAGRSDRMLLTVEGMIHLAGAQEQAPPAIYDVLGTRLKTVPVLIEVLKRTPRDEAARDTLYNAVFELLAELERHGSEIKNASARWRVRIDEAILELTGVLDLDDPRLSLLVLFYLGRMAAWDEIGRPLALEINEKTISALCSKGGSSSVRLVLAYTLAKISLHGPMARRGLARDFLPNETDPEVLRLMGDLSSAEGTFDALQKVLALEKGVALEKVLGMESED